MTYKQSYSTEKIKEKAILIGVNAFHSTFDFTSTMEELEALSATCELEVVETFTQNLTHVHPKYYMGTGKLQTLKDAIEFHDIDVIVANDELTTAQSKNLNHYFGVKIIDRTQLILEIFALRAQSKEGKLQVEFAQLDYLLPRLMGHGKSLSRLGGGIGTRGPGETKLETDRRHIRTRMNEIKRKLEEVESHRERYRQQRENNRIFQIALVGYTNAGKSSWFNTLTEEGTYEKDQLFATLDPKTRQLTLKEGFQLVISDTVGFIQKLPTTLIEAFKSTLEEARRADLLIHVVDTSHEKYKIQYDTVNQLLKDLSMDEIPQVVLFNKKDKCYGESPVIHHPSLFVSSKNKEDEAHVRQFIFEQLKRQMTAYTTALKAYQAQELYELKRHTLITEINFDEETETYHINGYKNN
ncbi:GTPase HflX [Staphylococcus chromogenes]|uniref:GTPase HflX n=1 Tax=Staphylococcus chromogenes TaxID=46126 RepID=UPI000D1B2C38|nr:GTPase HflX [Staphylococcus chromogenes]PUZ16499.1 GTPase HflX [Staphylococcus chromogenes]